MIYSPDINKVCALCLNADFITGNDDKMYCGIKKSESGKSDTCAKFSYDIFKKVVRRKRRLKTDYKPEDFSLDDDEPNDNGDK